MTTGVAGGTASTMAPAAGGTGATLTLLVTGGTGFVMSVLARQWLEHEPAAR